MPPKKQKCGYDKLKSKDKNLLEAAATAVNQRSLLDCFRNCDPEKRKSVNSMLLRQVKTKTSSLILTLIVFLTYRRN